MKNLLLAGFAILSINLINAQNKVNVYPKNSYVKENLDLNAVSNIYEQSQDIADFEKLLNYPESSISNLDLNDDNEVDYLRVIEKIENNIKIIIIQSELSPNVYEDVASINIILKNTNYTNDSGIRPRDIIIPFVYTILDIFLSRK